MGNRKIKISKFLSYILRHDPESIGVRVGPQGWAEIDQIIKKARSQGKNLERHILDKVVHESSKNRFDISDDGRFIRANYGHSIPVNLDYEPATPPEILFHGTASSNEQSIREKGIHAGGRQYVHLSPDKETASEVGQRHGSPIILRIHAFQMHNEGYDFLPTKSDVWLTKFVPPDYIE